MAVVIIPGTVVECPDFVLGAVEYVERDEETGQLLAIVVHHGRADYLLRIPRRFVESVAEHRIYLNVRHDDVQMAALLARDDDEIRPVESAERTARPEDLLSQSTSLPSGRIG